MFCLTEAFKDDAADRFRLVRSLYNLVYWMRREDGVLQNLTRKLNEIYQDLSRHEALTSRKRSRKEFEGGNGTGEGNGAEGGNDAEDAPPGKRSNAGDSFAEGYKIMKWTITSRVRWVFIDFTRSTHTSYRSLHVSSPYSASQTERSLSPKSATVKKSESLKV